jgi:hypothetical protein
LRSESLYESFLNSHAEALVLFNFEGMRLVGTEFQWEDGSKLQYNQWGPGQPTGGGEYLVVLSTDGFWDVQDSYTGRILCEKGIDLLNL